MKKCMISIFLFAMCAMTFCMDGKDVAAKKKTVKKSFVVMEGATREMTPDSYKTKWKITGGKHISISKDKLEPYSKVSPMNDAFTYGILAKGKKPGKAKVVVNTVIKKYIFDVKVVSKATVRKKSKALLKKYAAKLKNTKQCAYMDFNGDSVEDLYHDGQFTYYNYAVDKVVTKKAPLENIGSLYVSTKNHMMFAFPAKEIAFEDQSYSGTVFGRFFFMNEAKVFDFSRETVQYSKYKYPEKFVGDQYVPGNDYYFLDDNGYDQDDYWYIPYTKEQLMTKLAKLFPGWKEIAMTHKPVIR